MIRNNPAVNYSFINVEQLNTMVQSPTTCGTEVIRIPLVGCPNEPVPFSTEDITLYDGDVVFCSSPQRILYHRGLLPGARIPLPRDEDIDVIEAISMSTASAGGPLGSSGSVLSNGNVGSMREPTRVLILRKLPDGRQITIRVDLTEP